MTAVCLASIHRTGKGTAMQIILSPPGRSNKVAQKDEQMSLVRQAAHRSRMVRILVARRRLLLAVMAGLALLWLLPDTLRLATRLLLAWDLTAAVYIGGALWLILRSDVETCHERAALYDVSDWIIMMLVVASAAASFGAIFVELATIKSLGQMPMASLAVTAITVVLSWVFTHIIFTLHYANVYYRPESRGPPGGLIFPGNRAPDYNDFLYYAFVIGCAAQTGDVATTSTAMRHITLVHGIVSFAFNTAILALTINVGASLLS